MSKQKLIGLFSVVIGLLLLVLIVQSVLLAQMAALPEESEIAVSSGNTEVVSSDLPENTFRVSYTVRVEYGNRITLSITDVQAEGDAPGNLLQLPARIQYYPVEKIDSFPLQLGCGITTIELPDSLYEIGDMAFSGAFYSEILFPDTLDRIGDSAFEDCRFLAANGLHLPGVSKIGQRAFSGCAASEFIIGDGCTEIGSCAFGWDVKELWLPESIRICHAFAELQEDGSFAPLALSKQRVTLHFAGDEAAFREIDFGCPLPDGVEIVYRSAYTP